MKLTIHETAWAIVSENAINWHEDYIREMNIDDGKKNTVNLLYSNRCYDQANHILGKPIPLDEIIILLDRFWSREYEEVKTDEFRARVKQIISRYDEIIFESADGKSAVVEDEIPDIHGSATMPTNLETATDIPKIPCYGHGTSIEILTPYVLRLNILGEEPGVVLGKILLDPVQAKKLLHSLEKSLTEYVEQYGEVGEDYKTTPNVPA
ncbi:MAG: hypothetical protein KKH41_01565 [Candidatus Thermoplasmatota archaeon]|nr:hypothetical protein [Euryarchaeota archaeon]MBU4031862.1 hypothetical protein [Candidatus Thermoplasmatota archaeon]MBU4070688.1 hypothetical protein [Candidatus Thermoplasmatota archaeon]MBU4145268.1 hypothetical protein [Candidatus Thermoplasmatota archaeon]MBU4591250.1 hypothetical protein [Candidatus Thermoplasmatota archaeon]